MMVGPDDRDEEVADRIAEPSRPQLEQRRIGRLGGRPKLEHEHGDQHGEHAVGKEGQAFGRGALEHA